MDIADAGLPSPSLHDFTEGPPVEYRPRRVQSLLRPRIDGDDWHWTVEPYEGCERACLFCAEQPDRGGAAAWRGLPSRISVNVNAAIVLRQALRTQDLEHRPVVLGARTDPWQPAEARFRVTRSVLEVLAAHGGLDVRACTRAALVSRDADVLGAIARTGSARVTVSFATLDEELTRLLEPRAPSAEERLHAVSALARAGVSAGVMLSPLPPGLAPDPPQLEAFLARAADAGARFAGFQYLSLDFLQREDLLAQARAASPLAAARLSRLLDRPTAQAHQAFTESFATCCARLGLAPRR